MGDYRAAHCLMGAVKEALTAVGIMGCERSPPANPLVGPRMKPGVNRMTRSNTGCPHKLLSSWSKNKSTLAGESQ